MSDDKEREHCEAVAREVTGCGELCTNDPPEPPGSEAWCCAKVADLIQRERAAARAERHDVHVPADYAVIPQEEFNKCLAAAREQALAEMTFAIADSLPAGMLARCVRAIRALKVPR